MKQTRGGMRTQWRFHLNPTSHRIASVFTKAQPLQWLEMWLLKGPFEWWHRNLLAENLTG